MIVKILIHGQEDLGKLYTALSTPDNRPELDKDKCLFDASYKQMAMLVQDTKQKTEIDGEWDYTLTLDVAEFIGEMPSDGDLGPDLNTFEPVPGDWILKIFNAIGRFPLKPDSKSDEIPLNIPLFHDIFNVMSGLSDNHDYQLHFNQWMVDLLAAHRRDNRAKIVKLLNDKSSWETFIPSKADEAFDTLIYNLRRYCLGREG